MADNWLTGLALRESPRQPDYAFAYNTPILDPRQWEDFTWWSYANGMDPLGGSRDYDMQGAYLASLAADGRNHWDDEFKKPNHRTFSSGSMYASPEMPGGEWKRGFIYSVPGRGISPRAVPSVYVQPEERSLPGFAWPGAMREYMDAAEPGSMLVDHPMYLQRLMYPDFS